MADELTDQERARIRSLIVFQKVAMGIILRWYPLFLCVFIVLASSFSAYLWLRGSRSVKRYEATTRLIFSPKKIARIDAISDRQLMTILERPTIKRRVAERVKMDAMEDMCLSKDMKIEQGRRQGNVFILTAASKTYKGACAKVNAYADMLIDEYVSFRSADFDAWKKSLETRRKGFIDKLADVDAEEAAFKTRTGALAPSEALVALNTLISDQRRNDSALGVEIANEELKKRKLEGCVGKSGSAVVSNAAAIRRRVDAISAIDAELASLREKYTDINPRVSGRVAERAERVAELQQFLKSKGADGFELDQIDQIEKAAGELADSTTRLEALAEKRTALERELHDNEKRAAELASTVMDYERIVTKRDDIMESIRDLDDQLGGITYAVESLRNDLRQIERAAGSDDNGPFGSKKAVMAVGGAFVCAGGLLFLIVLVEYIFGNVLGGREISAYDEMEFLGSLPAHGAMSEEDEREAMGVVALKMLLAGKDSKVIFVCRLPRADPNERFTEAIDFTATMSGSRCFMLDIVSHEDFSPPAGAEEMVGAVRSGSRGWFPVANRFAMAPTEIEMLKADVEALGGTYDNVFIRLDRVAHVSGTFFEQILALCGAVVLFVGDGTTPRRALAFARRHLKAAGKRIMAVATNSSAKRVRADIEVLS